MAKHRANTKEVECLKNAGSNPYEIQKCHEDSKNAAKLPATAAPAKTTPAAPVKVAQPDPACIKAAKGDPKKVGECKSKTPAPPAPKIIEVDPVCLIREI